MLAVLRAFEPASDSQGVVAPGCLETARFCVVVTHLLLEYAVESGKVAYLINTNALSSLSAPAIKIKRTLPGLFMKLPNPSAHSLPVAKNPA